MAKGTISITNGATTINGDGTIFTSELVAGDYIVFTAGQVVYTQAIKTVSSDTVLTLTRTYTGPDAAGLAWSGGGGGTMSQVTMEVVNQVTEALRGLNLDKANWQQVFSAGENITVTLPDGSQFKGPSWPSLVSLLEDLDPGSLQKIVEDIKQAQASVSADRQAAETASSGAKASADNAGAAKKAAEDAMAVASRGASDAAASASTAAQAVGTASQAATDARAQADRAQSLADKFDAEKVLTKDANLSDVTDRAVSLQNLLNGKPLPLPAEAVSDYDAVTLRQLKASSGGGGGASMNGVMNDFIGAVQWFNGSRAALPAGYIAADGQLESRTDAKTADLWAAVNAGILTATQTDAVWLTSSNAGAPAMNRGMYSPGNGTTTFRVPDLNGIQDGSIKSPFLRGAASGDVVGRILQDSAPNISGQLFAYNYDQSTSGKNGFVSWTNGGNNVFQLDGTTTSSTRYERYVLDASTQNANYGRDGSGEIHPNEVFGIWIIRASGAFQAAGTSFDVVNSYATQPGSGVLMRGGDVKSTMKVAGQVKSSASLVALQRVGARPFSAITVNDGATTRVYSIPASDVDVELLATNSPQGAVAWCRFSGDTIVAAFNISSVTKEAAGAYRLVYQNPPADEINQSIMVTAIQGSNDVNAISGSVYSISKTSFAVATRNNTGRIDASVMVTVHRK
ncbi:hypothetical protein BN132_104 [Cronobacter turicensis 564]|nr:hypothetical protein BN132_104 [Cronobacter turicensis 564]